MKTAGIRKEDNPVNPLAVLDKALERRAQSEDFIQKSIRKYREDLRQMIAKDDDKDEIIGFISDPILIDLLAEQIYLDEIRKSCESKISSAELRLETIKDRIKQHVCDKFDLPDDEPIKIDIANMNVLRGDREARIKDIKKEICSLFDASEDELNEIINKAKERSVKGDLANILIGDHREDTIKLCKEIFQATEKDGEFLENVMNSEDVPKPIKFISDFIMKERGIKCQKKKIIEWQ